MTQKHDYIELKVNYPFVRLLDEFKCRTILDNRTYETSYKITVRQIPGHPVILSHSLGFAGVSKAYLTLQIDQPTVDPPVDKYRIAYRGIFNYYQQEYWADFNAINSNESDRNTIYVVKLDVDYTQQDLIAFKVYAHNPVGWSNPTFN
ncbi:uncharacterized protein LOC128954214 [Oppia nitens]|uniref:uncharacterized protein LOC128954214 n=1 Tax=Oppia nitens TaxID=1686743 RepID=UPI0023D9E082|nr:uncharacterized protein LOC128954214 [Oppia nitens]